MFVDYRKVPDVDMYIGMHAIDVYTREPAQEQSFTQHLAYTLNLKLPPKPEAHSSFYRHTKLEADSTFYRPRCHLWGVVKTMGSKSLSEFRV